MLTTRNKSYQCNDATVTSSHSFNPCSKCYILVATIVAHLTSPTSVSSRASCVLARGNRTNSAFVIKDGTANITRGRTGEFPTTKSKKTCRSPRTQKNRKRINNHFSRPPLKIAEPILKHWSILYNMFSLHTPSFGDVVAC